MTIFPESIYHLYNRGNNQQVIFPEKRNYDFFLQKTVIQLHPYLDFLAYCLMPNHFHFLIYIRPATDPKSFSNSFRTLLSSYTRAIQKQEGITGSLFQQNSKAKKINDDEYAHTCFHYIHQNPLRARLVNKMEAWPHHSFNEYWKRENGICNVKLAGELLTVPIEPNQFYAESYAVIPKEVAMEFE